MIFDTIKNQSLNRFIIPEVQKNKILQFPSSEVMLRGFEKSFNAHSYGFHG